MTGYVGCISRVYLCVGSVALVPTATHRTARLLLALCLYPRL